MYYLAEYKTFKSTKELNEALLTHINRHYYDMNDTDRAILKQIGRYAVKYCGVAQLKADTLSDLIGKSSKTIRRTLTKLVALNIIEKRKTTRPKSGGYGANIIIILPPATSEQASLFDNDVQSGPSTREVVETTRATRLEDSKVENESFTLSKRKEKPNTHKDTINRAIIENDGNKISQEIKASDVPASALADSIPTPVYTAITKYFKTAEELYTYYGILLRAKASVDRGLMIEESPETFTDAWHRAIFAWKSGRVRKSFEALLYSAFEQAAVTVIRQRNKPSFATSWLTG